MVVRFYASVFQPFSSRGTFETLLSVWRNLGTLNQWFLMLETWRPTKG